MSLKKTYAKDRRTCKVSFDLPIEAVKGAKAVTLVGDFNNWSLTATPLIKAKDGAFSVTISLDSGREYYFRYCLDGTRWENDWNADKYVPSPYGDSDNSVVIV
jgi:1,4-alpha-glucan branching enzyme